MIRIMQYCIAASTLGLVLAAILSLARRKSDKGKECAAITEVAYIEGLGSAAFDVTWEDIGKTMSNLILTQIVLLVPMQVCALVGSQKGFNLFPKKKDK